jgi:hypothetical protein
MPAASAPGRLGKTDRRRDWCDSKCIDGLHVDEALPGWRALPEISERDPVEGLLSLKVGGCATGASPAAARRNGVPAEADSASDGTSDQQCLRGASLHLIDAGAGRCPAAARG